MITVENQVRWSFEIMSRPVMGRAYLVAGRDPGRGALTEYECHAQAALVIRNCERVLPPLHLAYVRLRFGCDPSGYDLLVPYVAASLRGATYSPGAIEKIIGAYCWDEVGLREIRESMACGMQKAIAYRNKAYKALDVLHREAINRLWKELPLEEDFISMRRQSG